MTVQLSVLQKASSSRTRSKLRARSSPTTSPRLCWPRAPGPRAACASSPPRCRAPIYAGWRGSWGCPAKSSPPACESSRCVAGALNPVTSSARPRPRCAIVALPRRAGPARTARRGCHGEPGGPHPGCGGGAFAGPAPSHGGRPPHFRLPFHLGLLRSRGVQRPAHDAPGMAAQVLARQDGVRIRA